MLMRFSIFVLLNCCLLSTVSAAAPPYILEADLQPEPLGLHLDYLEDKAGELSLEQVTSPAWQAKFVTSQSGVPSFGRAQSVYWFRLNIDSQLPDEQEMFLYVKRVSAKTLTVYIRQANDWQHIQTGQVFPFQQRPLALTNYVYPVHLQAGQQQEIYIRLYAPIRTHLPLSLMTAEQLAIEQFQQIRFPAFFYGALAILALYNLFIFFSVKDALYLYYIFFNVIFIPTDMHFRGYAFQYLWPNWPILNDTLGMSIYLMYPALFLLLTQKLLELHNYSRVLNLIMNLVIAIFVSFALAEFIFPNVTLVPLLAPALLLYPLLAFVSSIYVWWQGGRTARYLLTGWGVVIISTFIFTLSVEGVLPTNFWTTHSIQLSILLFSIIASLALADRINALRAERQIAQQQALHEAQEKQRIAEQNLQLQDDNIRMAAELDVTRQLQSMVLPSAVELTQIKSLDIACWMEPAEEVGGDYYDVLQYQDKVIIGMGDVVGHGLASGVMMLMVQTAVRALSISNAANFFQVLNHTIYDNVQRMGIDKALTLVMLDYQQGKLSISGQHEEVLVIRCNGGLEHIDTIDLGFMIGVERDIDRLISVYNIELAPGDGIVLYTDGITEAFDEQDRQYGLERLCDVTRQHWSKSALDIKNAVLKDFHQYVGNNKIMDDCTLMVVKQQAI